MLPKSSLSHFVFILLLSLTHAGESRQLVRVATSRATDWTAAGISGGIPSKNWTQCGPTIAAYSGSGSTIINAMNHTGSGYTKALAAPILTSNSALAHSLLHLTFETSV